MKPREVKLLRATVAQARADNTNSLGGLLGCSSSTGDFTFCHLKHCVQFKAGLNTFHPFSLE